MSYRRFNSAIISPDSSLAEHYSKELTRSNFIGNVDCTQGYPTDEALHRTLRLNPPDLFLLDCTDLPRTLHIIGILRRHNPDVQILALCQEDVKILSALMRSGVRDYIPTDAPLHTARETLATSIEALHSKPKQPTSSGSVVAFLPGKPGSGASTIAANVAFSASQSPNSRVLLVDLDRDAPVQAFLNQLHPEHFLQEAFDNSHQLDSDIWSRVVSQRGALDILPADADGLASPENKSAQELLRFFRRAYDLTCIDLPGPLDSCSVEVLMEAKRVYLVCTQDLAAIHVTLRRADRLRRLGLDKEIRILLNRYVSNHIMTRDRVADLTGIPVEMTLPNSYALTAESIEKGSTIDPATPLGKSYTKLAQLLLNNRIEVPRKQRRFLDFLYQPFARPEATEA